jgi:hypothetical protein
MNVATQYVAPIRSIRGIHEVKPINGDVAHILVLNEHVYCEKCCVVVIR